MITPKLNQLDGDLFLPDHNLSIKTVFPLALEALNIKLEKKHPTPIIVPSQVRNLINTEEEFDNCIIWIVDGLGTEASNIPWLNELITRNGGWLSSVFPSTTAAAIASMLTGVSPARHGLLGTKMFVPEIGMTVNLLTLKAARATIKVPIYEVGVDPSTWLWHRPIHEELSSEIRFYHFLTSHLVNSGYSRIIYTSKDKNIGYWLPHDGIERMRMILEDIKSSTAKKNLFIFYNNYVDSVSHHFTKESPFHHLVIEVIKNAWLKTLPRFSRTTLEKTLLIFASDHGQVVPSNDKIINIDKNTWEQWLKESHHCIGSSGRTLDFHVPESRIEEFRSSIELMVGDLGLVKTTEELLDALDSNPRSLNLEKLKMRFGTIHVILRDEAQFSFPPDTINDARQNDDISKQFGQFLSTHGSLTKDELFTPFFATSLAEFFDVLQST